MRKGRVEEQELETRPCAPLCACVCVCVCVCVLVLSRGSWSSGPDMWPAPGRGHASWVDCEGVSGESAAGPG
eukprot:8586040-Pyramimonas_sp.AAC.1